MLFRMSLSQTVHKCNCCQHAKVRSPIRRFDYWSSATSTMHESIPVLFEHYQAEINSILKNIENIEILKILKRQIMGSVRPEQIVPVSMIGEAPTLRLIAA